MNLNDQKIEQMREVLKLDVVQASKRLLGWKIVCNGTVSEIVETEAYRADDPGCHAFGKKKMKNMSMFGPPVIAYIYFTYGNHWMLCISAHEQGDPAAVLIRAIRPISGFQDDISLAGPGRLTRELGVTGSDNGIDLLCPESRIHFAPGDFAGDIGTSRRIGISIGKGDETLWRFVSVQHLQWCTKHKFNREIEINRLINN